MEHIGLPVTTVCENENSAIEALGAEVAKSLKLRLADLYAASTVSDLLLGNPGIVASDLNSKYKIDLCNNYRLVFCANKVKVPLDENGNVDWAIINRIKILVIENE